MPVGDITRLLDEFRRGDPGAEQRLFQAVYRELRSVAARQLRLERRNHTLQPTALVHEAYLRLAPQRDTDWHDRRHFFAMAARAMRRILVDHARRSAAKKRLAGFRREDLVDNLAYTKDNCLETLALDEALERLAQLNLTHSKVVELTYFGGLTTAETAAVLGIGQRTVEKYLRLAKAWMRMQLDSRHDDHVAKLATRG
jgi:RNA polymerase sigma factor (TIGR02999 family)